MNILSMQRLPLKVLFKESGRLFIFFLLGTAVLASLHDLNPRSVLIRTGTLIILLVIIFGINVLLFDYFNKHKKRPQSKIWRKTFVVGFLLSIPVFFIHNALLRYLINTKIIADIYMPGISDNLHGWRYTIFIIYGSFILYFFVFMIQNLVLNRYEKNAMEVEMLKLKNSNAETVNQLLQQQVKPHFLFNALNILKSLIRKDPKKAETYLLRLSDFLRISITQNPSGLSTVNQELKICSDYMEMQKIRFGKALQYQVLIDNDAAEMDGVLPFFSIQPLLENAIKHNELTDDKPLKIRVEADNAYIVVTNNLQEKTLPDASTGNGHGILKERYKILSGDEVLIRKTKTEYAVSLKILPS
ncbi:MAG: sensor histidine kinase [Niabella sp.]